MQDYLKNISGDKTLWAVVILLAVFSFLPAVCEWVGKEKTSLEANMKNIFIRNK